MNLDDMKKAWSEVPDSAGGKMEALVTKVLKAERFERQILRRDYRDTAAAAIAVAGFTPALFFLKDWTSWLGVLIIIVGALMSVILVHWVRRKGGETPLDVSLAQYFQAERIRVERQITLSQRVAWVLAPMVIGECLFVVGVGLRRPPTLPRLCFTALLLLTFLLVAVVVYWLNQRAVQRKLIPLRDALKQAEEDLTNDVGTSA